MKYFADEVFLVFSVENGNAGNNNEFQSVHKNIQQFSEDISELKLKADIFQKNFTAVWLKVRKMSYGIVEINFNVKLGSFDSNLCH